MILWELREHTDFCSWSYNCIEVVELSSINHTDQSPFLVAHTTLTIISTKMLLLRCTFKLRLSERYHCRTVSFSPQIFGQDKNCQVKHTKQFVSIQFRTRTKHDPFSIFSGCYEAVHDSSMHSPRKHEYLEDHQSEHPVRKHLEPLHS
jgi:hypothetical protein